MKTHEFGVTGECSRHWKSLPLVAAFLLLSATAALAQTTENGRQVRKRLNSPIKVSIFDPKDGAVFYGNSKQRVCGAGLDDDGQQVDHDTYQWKDTVNGKTSVIASRLSCFDYAFTVGDHKVTLEVLDGRRIVASKSISVAVLDPIR